MNKDLKTRWLEALRSGRYEQGYDVFRGTFTDAFCCLGVLLDIEAPNGWALDSKGVRIHEHADVNGYWFKSRGVEDPVFDHLVNMNDGGTSFIEIADWIEENISEA